MCICTVSVFELELCAALCGLDLTGLKDFCTGRETHK